MEEKLFVASLVIFSIQKQVVFLFNCIFCIELIASRLGVAAWDDCKVSRGKEITTLPLICTFVKVS